MPTKAQPSKSEDRDSNSVSNSMGTQDVAEGERGAVENALRQEDEKHLKKVIDQNSDHKTKVNWH